ncbi:MAG TPA: hypothetical protein DCL75_12980 [Ktedonobacter sp.]|nr:hypothetical protein [Ktedonobacter sp.]
MRIDEILAYNERFVEQTHLPTIGHAPRRHMAVVTCMDCRLVQMFEQALGLERGDVLEPVSYTRHYLRERAGWRGK